MCSGIETYVPSKDNGSPYPYGSHNSDVTHAHPLIFKAGLQHTASFPPCNTASSRHIAWSQPHMAGVKQEEIIKGSGRSLPSTQPAKVATSARSKVRLRCCWRPAYQRHLVHSMLSCLDLEVHLIKTENRKGLPNVYSTVSVCVCFKPTSHTSQVGLELSMQSKMALNF